MSYSQPPPLPAAGGYGVIPPRPDVGRGIPPLLRPMGIGELLDAAFRLYRAKWRLFMGIVALVLVPMNLAQALLGRLLIQPAVENLPPVPTEPGGQNAITEEVFRSFFLRIGLGVLIFTVVGLFVTAFITAALARGATDVYLGGEPTIGTTFRYAIRRVHSIVWVTFLGILTFLIAAVPIVAVALLVAAVPEAGPLLFFAVIGGVILAILVFIRFTFGSIAVVVEDLRGKKALGRSWRLSKGSFWRIFGTLLLASILAGILTFVIAIGFTIAGGAEDRFFLGTIGQTLGAIVAQPFSSIIVVLLYFDLRIRKEGLDLAFMAQELASRR